MSETLALRPRSYRRAVLGFVLAVVLPTLLAAAYYGIVAADRYVTEFRYSVRGGAIMPGGEGGGVHGGAALVFAADSFVLENYLRSLAAIADLEEALPLRRMLAQDGGDFVRRFDPSAPVEELLPFWRAAVAPRFDVFTGITTVEVALFSPEDSNAVAQALVLQLRRIVDGLSAEARNEMLAYVQREFERAAADLDAVRERIEAFRRANQIITPTEQVAIGADIIAALSARLSANRVELRTLRQQTPNSPRIAALDRENRSLEDQLAAEFARRSGEAGAALPTQITSFDALENDHQVARETYVAALQLRQQAEAFATLGRPELVVFVPPRPAMTAILPKRATEIAIVFAVSFAVWLIGRILWASLTSA